MFNRVRCTPHRGPIALAAVLLVIPVLLAGCGGDSATTDTEGSSKGGEAATRGGTLHLADTAEAETLDPTTALSNPSVNALTQIMETLFKSNAKGEIEPWLVSESKQSADGLSWTFELRRGVEFSDGKPLTAEDVVFSIDAVRKSAGWASMFEPITDVRATSPSTVVVKTDKRVVALPAELSLFAAAIVPKNYGGATKKDFGQDPVGTGPFELGSWARGQAMTLVRNPHYWKLGQPLLDKVVIESVPDVNSRTTQLQGGELDVMASPDWSQIPGLEATPDLHVGVYAMGYLDFFTLNSRNTLLADPRAREAFSLALDREGIVEAALHGYGEPAGPWIPPAIAGHDAGIKPVAQNVAKAKGLLAEAVQATGAKPKLTLLYFSGDTYYSTVSQVAQQNLEDVGFEVNLQPLDEATAISQMSAGKFDAAPVYFSSDIADPSEAGSIYVGSEGVYSRGKLDEVAKLTAEAGSEQDEAKRMQLYGQMQEVIAREQNIVPYDYRPFVWAMGSDVTGFELNTTGHPWLAETGFTE
jgi:peptide/nickel transport system substrate-binding protein